MSAYVVQNCILYSFKKHCYENTPLFKNLVNVSSLCHLLYYYNNIVHGSIILTGNTYTFTAFLMSDDTENAIELQHIIIIIIIYTSLTISL